MKNRSTPTLCRYASMLLAADMAFPADLIAELGSRGILIQD
jgi:hypothetical protein